MNIVERMAQFITRTQMDTGHPPARLVINEKQLHELSEASGIPLSGDPNHVYVFWGVPLLIDRTDITDVEDKYGTQPIQTH